MNNMPFYTPNFIPDYPNINSMQNEEISKLEKKVDNLYKEIDHLKTRINRLEDNKNNNYSYTYQPNSYNMM